MSLLKIYNCTHQISINYSKKYIAGYVYDELCGHGACDKERGFSNVVVIKLFDDNKFTLLFKNKTNISDFLREFDKWISSDDKSAFFIKTYDEKEREPEESHESDGLLDLLLKKAKSQGSRDYVDSFGIMQ